MTIHPRFLLTAALLGGGAAGRAASTPADSETFVFNLLPNSLSKTPLLGMTVFTEMTPYGRTLPAPSAAAPVPFAAHDLGQHSRGDLMGERAVPAPEALRTTMFAALAVNGFQPAVAGQRPALVLFYYWGSYHSMDSEMIRLFPEMHMRQVLERAALVGGSAYRQKIAAEIEAGATFVDRTGRRGDWWDQIYDGIYFVVVSAYDPAELAAGRRRLAWRTTLTVTTDGVSPLDAVPPLVAAAGNYFGRETLEPVTITRRTRRGTVTLGPLKILPNSDPEPHDRN